MQLDDLCRALHKADKGVLVLDVCSLLDVIRAPVRDNLPVIEIALRIEREIQQMTLPVSLVLPSLFQTEWTDNIAAVRDELSGAVMRHHKQSGNFDRLHQLVYGVTLPFPDVIRLQLEQKLDDLCLRIQQHALVLSGQDQLDVRAMRRVIAHRAPSRKGKQEAKDCLIFEETLELGRQLRTQNFARKIVFVSSNETDYGKTGNPHPEIKVDLDAIQADFASTLNYAYHIASK